MSWYRTYRPQTVAALHIAPVREAFTRILESGEFSHAYLLTGPKGTGKTSGARILAKALNCERNRDAIVTHKKQPLKEPCNVCATCVAITNGSSLCVSEMDAASNRGIDDIRELTARLGLSPGDGPISVVIIDEVHMLTTEAFNALLKVLEEPPAHVVMILATTDAQKLPATVISRCQIITYRKASSEEIERALTQIAKLEGIQIDADVLTPIIAYADGSFRDGVKVFEQIAKGRSQVTLADVVQVLGVSITALTENLVQLLAKRDYIQVAAIFSRIDQDGIDLVLVQKEVLKSLYIRMLAAPAAKNPHFPAYVALVKSLNIPTSPLLPMPGLPFEIACLEWCLNSGGSTKSVPIAKTIGIEKPIANTSQPMVVDQPIPSVVEALKPTPVADKPKPIDSESVVSEVNIIKTEPVVSVPTSVVIPITFAMILEKWHVVLGSIRAVNGSLESLLKTTKPLNIENNKLRLEVFYQFHKDQLTMNRNLLIMEEVLEKTFSTPIRIEFVLGTRVKEAAPAPDAGLSGVVDLSFVKAAEAAFL